MRLDDHFAARRLGYEQPTTIPQVQDFGARITVEALRSTSARKDNGNALFHKHTSSFPSKGKTSEVPPYF
jgi:hypothetical protein